MKKSTMRGMVPAVLAERGFSEVRARSSQGLLPGSRLIALHDGQEVDLAVKASVERSLSFTKQSNGRWRTASAVDLVVAIVPALGSPEDLEVLAFDRKPLIAVFEKAWKALEKAGRSLSFEIPIFVPLDEVSRKNLGHNIANLKTLRIWSVRLTREEVKARSLVESAETFYDRVKREFAERSGIDVSKVEVEFRIKP